MLAHATWLKAGWRFGMTKAKLRAANRSGAGESVGRIRAKPRILNASEPCLTTWSASGTSRISLN